MWTGGRRKTRGRSGMDLDHQHGTSIVQKLTFQRGQRVFFLLHTELCHTWLVSFRVRKVPAGLSSVLTPDRKQWNLGSKFQSLFPRIVTLCTSYTHFPQPLELHSLVQPDDPQDPIHMHLPSLSSGSRFEELPHSPSL